MEQINVEASGTVPQVFQPGYTIEDRVLHGDGGRWAAPGAEAGGGNAGARGRRAGSGSPLRRASA
jgi:hypothetical protein